MTLTLAVKPDMLVASAFIRINPENIYMPPAFRIVGRDAFPVKSLSIDHHVSLFLTILLPILIIPQKFSIFVSAGRKKRILFMKNPLFIIPVPYPGFCRQRRRNRIFSCSIRSCGYFMLIPFPVIPGMHYNLDLSGEPASLVFSIGMGVMLLMKNPVLIIPVLWRIACLRRKSHAEAPCKKYRRNDKTRKLFQKNFSCFQSLSPPPFVFTCKNRRIMV